MSSSLNEQRRHLTKTGGLATSAGSVMSQNAASAPDEIEPINIDIEAEAEYRLPEVDEAPDQDEEWLEIRKDDGWKRIRFHDYDEIYRIPGLYEDLFYRRLKCQSPAVVASLLIDAADADEFRPDTLRVLDLGAGNGIVGEVLRQLGAKTVLGADIIPEAHDAARRDRPGVYDDYFVLDFTTPPEADMHAMRDARLNCLVTVAALGFGDIPPLAFANAFNLVAEGGWIAFNLMEDFLSGKDSTGFAALIRSMMNNDIIEEVRQQRYRHRYSMAGDPIHYVAFAVRKKRHLADAELARLSG